MPEIYIDNKRFEFDQPGKLLQFMLDHGLDMPFFCYHPSLSVPANCRQCMVKAGMPVFNRERNEWETDDAGNRVVRFFPKLMTACSLDMADGMVVHTHHTDELVKQAQADNLEFILINHPLDCPICDQAGECPLQILTYKYGPEGSRFEHKKVHKPKAVVLGPRVILDAERCINCTRCTRFTEEISKSGQLSIVSRGDKNYPITADGKVFDDPYSLNTVDICPVGALTSADVRFKARVWEMNQTPGVDITNGKGCNTWLWTRDNLVLRITPRFNEAVNDHWMPDVGREAYHHYNENRISGPIIGLGQDNQVSTSWNNARLSLAEVLETVSDSAKILVVGSARMSLEDNFAFKTFFSTKGVSRFLFVPHVEPGSGDGFLITDDKYPNTIGVRELGFEAVSGDGLEQIIETEKPEFIALLDDDLVGRGTVSSELLSGTFSVQWASNHNDTTRAVSLVIPATTAVEHAASYVNVDGRIQRTVPAKETRYTDRRLNLEMSMSRLDHYGTRFDNWVNDENRIDCLPVWEFLGNLESDRQNGMWQSSREILMEVSRTISAFNGVSYEKMDRENGVQITLNNTPEVKTV